MSVENTAVAVSVVTLPATKPRVPIALSLAFCASATSNFCSGLLVPIPALPLWA
ncbi:MAG: hypothetical protein M9931_05340 [Chitinophagales bacterium]|nr:hypothetical protein [Chitinophagales bacterium]